MSTELAQPEYIEPEAPYVPPTQSPTDFVLQEIGRERIAQDAKWGEQNHPDGTGEMYARDAENARFRCQRAAGQAARRAGADRGCRCGLG